MTRYRCTNPHNPFAGHTALGRDTDKGFEVQLDDFVKWSERMEQGYSPSGWERQERNDWTEIQDTSEGMIL